MEEVSGYGLQVRLAASVTFPTGFNLTQFADDADPLDMPSIQIADQAMGLNGDLIVWAKPQPIPLSIAVISGSNDDINLGILFQANKVSKGKPSTQDRITLVISYPNGRKATFANGKITDGMPAYSVASAGRQKSKVYKFTFENYANT